MTRNPNRGRNHRGDPFAFLALIALIAAAAGLVQGHAVGWTLAAVMILLAVVCGALAWIGWTTPRNEDDQQ
jgi:membrane protein implicated in regulation of membrane protease activity